MKLVITIDTEEDNWGRFQPDGCTVENVRWIPSLQALFDEFTAVPTYLVTYPVATDPQAVLILRSILERRMCEIGAHCHPWNTPPFGEDCNERNSMLCNLPVDLQLRKLDRLHEAIVGSFQSTPVSFRAGRWGFSKEVSLCLDKLGYRVDTSVLPFIDWTPQCGPDFSLCSADGYWFDPDQPFSASPQGKVLEVPATIEFTQKNAPPCNKVFNVLKERPWSQFRLIGVLDRLGLLNKIWLSPEQSSAKEMIALTKALMKKGFHLINLFFHSPTLQPGLTPYVQTEADRQRFLEKIREFLTFTRSVGIRSIPLAEAVWEIPRR